MNYYNEFDPKAAAWLRELIKQGHIPAGDVDERSITDVLPTDLSGYTQCHFFAGIGGWSLALQLAKWPTDRPVWTGSCPCQPFSAAGKQKGTADERHLWPVFGELIAQCRPPIVFGEQVASKPALGWLDGVFADLEGSGYACAAADLCAAGVGAPQIRQRLYWVGYAQGLGRHTCRNNINASERNTLSSGTGGSVVGLADTGCERDESRRGDRDIPSATEDTEGKARQWKRCRDAIADSGPTGGLAHHTCSDGRKTSLLESQHSTAQARERKADEPRGSIASVGLGDPDHPRPQGRDERGYGASELPTGAASVAGFWSDFDLLPCTDGKTRRIEPGSFPLAHGVPGRVGLLRGYGNAIVPPLAAKFIQAVQQILG